MVTSKETSTARLKRFWQARLDSLWTRVIIDNIPIIVYLLFIMDYLGHLSYVETGAELAEKMEELDRIDWIAAKSHFLLGSLDSNYPDSFKYLCDHFISAARSIDSDNPSEIDETSKLAMQDFIEFVIRAHDRHKALPDSAHANYKALLDRLSNSQNRHSRSASAKLDEALSEYLSYS